MYKFRVWSWEKWSELNKLHQEPNKKAQSTRDMNAQICRHFLFCCSVDTPIHLQQQVLFACVCVCVSSVGLNTGNLTTFWTDNGHKNAWCLVSCTAREPAIREGQAMKTHVRIFHWCLAYFVSHHNKETEYRFFQAHLIKLCGHLRQIHQNICPILKLITRDVRTRGDVDAIYTWHTTTTAAILWRTDVVSFPTLFLSLSLSSSVSLSFSKSVFLSLSLWPWFSLSLSVLSLSLSLQHFFGWDLLLSGKPATSDYLWFTAVFCLVFQIVLFYVTKFCFGKSRDDWGWSDAGDKKFLRASKGESGREHWEQTRSCS